MNDLLDENALNIIKSISFKCVRCSDCCRIDPGAVMLTQDDLKKISSYLKISESQFIKDYCRPIYKGINKIVSLKEKSNYDCIFWNDGCLIYEARPVQCQTYPYWTSIINSKENLLYEKKRCRGIDNGDDIKLDDKIKYYLLSKKIMHLNYPE